MGNMINISAKLFDFIIILPVFFTMCQKIRIE